MVKPIFPLHHQDDADSASWDRNGRTSARPRASLRTLSNFEDSEGAVGFTSNGASVLDGQDEIFARGDEFHLHTENRVGFPNAQGQWDNRNPSESFASYDGVYTRGFGNFASVLTPAPRERISSLPETENDSHSRRPVPRQRRNSAPVLVDFPGGESTAERNDDLDIPPALREIANKGQELFWFILSEEVKVREAAEPGRLSALTIPPSQQRMDILNERSRPGGRTLRQIADLFSRSPQRLWVRDYAETIDLQSLNYNSFINLLFGLFQEGGVTQERVLVLFFFCADVALRALREKFTARFQQLVDWTSRYITERLSSWVYEHGGWAAVLHESVDQAYKLAVIGICCVSVVACAVLVWRRMLQ